MAPDAEIVDQLGTVGRAFFGGFHRLREIQRQAAIPILAGQDVLVTSVTASGKTEAIMAPLVARIFRRGIPRSGAIRLLLVAPTRALVNDLAARVEGPLTQMGLSCGRQTSDHRDKSKRPFTLITTPESFDSMLVRDGEAEGGNLTGHLLAGVSAVFIDEAHLFDGTARGDQLCWLLGRLRRLRHFAKDERAGDDGQLQVCAASATVSDPDGLARRLLSPRAVAVRVTGAREVEIFAPSDEPCWFPLEASVTESTVNQRLELVPSANLGESVEHRLWQALSGAESEPMRKVLVFVPTRNLCDTVSAHLSATLPRRRDIRVLAHHGSLDRNRREQAEQTFSSTRDAVLVATTTLEVGVDIGDVDLVALVGAPPGTRSLLQRIGRAGRRIGRTRVLALPRTAIERAAFASMLVSARDGTLEPESYARRWSVFVQQAASFVAQARPRGRRFNDLLELAHDVWPETPPRTAKEILQELLDGEYLEEHMGRLILGEPWADAFDQGSGGMHANLDSSAAGVPVVDSSTGEVIAHVAERPAVHRGVALGGQVWDARYVDGEVLLTARTSGQVREGFRYATRSAPTGLEYAIHVRRGLGFVDVDAPIVSIQGDSVWMHFGGSAYQAALVRLLPSLRPVSGLAGLAVMGRPSKKQLNKLASQEGDLLETIEALFESIELTLAPGPYHRYLPEACRKRVTVGLFDLPRFRSWLASRNIWEIRPDDQRLVALRAALSGNS